jgi:uncharacterized protein (DUF608 family)
VIINKGINMIMRKKNLVYNLITGILLLYGSLLFSQEAIPAGSHGFNDNYSGKYIDHIAFPVGGIGAGMFCIEGNGAISHMSVRTFPDLNNEPRMFAAISVKGLANGTKVLEGQVPDWKKFGPGLAALGCPGALYGLPRFENAFFLARFPFATIELNDVDLPLEVKLTGWSPFIPGDADNSSLPVGAIEYAFRNTGTADLEAVFSYNAFNFMNQSTGSASIKPIQQGFILSEEGTANEPFKRGFYAIISNDKNTLIDHCWFRGGYFDDINMAWNRISKSGAISNPPIEKGAPAASLFVPFRLKPGEKKVIRILMSWYVPNSTLRIGAEPTDKKESPEATADPSASKYYVPWYAGRFSNINEVAAYWLSNYDDLKYKSELFTDAFFNSTLPSEVVEAVAANLTILKSPTVLRQYDGRLWGWEGCLDNWGNCHGSCTHVWNYAQGVSLLFPSLERSLRDAEFNVSQNAEGHQAFRTSIPIRAVNHDFYAASDGQLGGIMKVYRDWRTCGDENWLKALYPKVKSSMDYCIRTWDPRHTGVLEEPHHNTYDIEFWGPDGMCSSYYLGALSAIIKMGEFLHDDVSFYRALYLKGKRYMEDELFNGAYFIQKIMWKGLNSPDPTQVPAGVLGGSYSDEARQLLEVEGPKYQYGDGCLSDGIIGAWMGEICGLDQMIDPVKVRSHLVSVYKYNYKSDLKNHANFQRSTYAFGHEGGLVLCTWPKGNALSLPFIYCNEVWTGVEYQVASHLMFMGEVEKGLDIVRTCRKRYDGQIRNPFDEYEYGHWYARAMSSYSLLQGLTGTRYDAVDHTLYINSRIGDFTSFISAETGFGNVGLRNGRPYVTMAYGTLDIRKIMVSGVEMKPE